MNEIITLPVLPPSELVNCLVERADLPRRIATEMMIGNQPELILQATVFYFDCIEADNGDKDAKERVDLMREKVQQHREVEKALGNNPDVGYMGPRRNVARVGIPQPMNPGTLPGAPSKKELIHISDKSSQPKYRLSSDE